MKEFDVYLYGMILRTNSFLLNKKFPNPDTYNEIKEKYHLPGGETGTAATVLASLGCKIKMDGNHIGCNIAETIKAFYGNIDVDISSLTFAPNYDGLEDYIIIDKDTRTAFGQFAAYYQDYYERNIIRWNSPLEDDIKKTKVAGIDPFFDKQALLAAQYCNKHNIPFVTIDERPDKEICRLASIIAVSSEYIRDSMPDYYSDEGKIRLLQEYAKNTNALVIFTGGGGTIVYGRDGEAKKFSAYKVDTVSTLGAGDTFKAGCIYGLLQSYDDDKIVKFASACAAVACTKFPLPLNPPKLEEVLQLL
ncbi:MAG: carbohydrate kinase family protein [Fibromonadales bacterium]|nr:carbohydrate kinase family protein [Fibromonadales bacterium]